MQNVLRRLVGFGLAVAIGFTGHATPVAQEGDAAMAAVLDQYARGDLEGALAAALGQRPDALVKGIERSGSRWIAAGGATATDRRRLAAAVFTLDVANQWRQSHWPLGRRLITWAAAELAASPAAGAAERLWFRASVTLFEGADDWLFLAGRPASVAKPGKQTMTTHLSVARGKFADDPRLQLAEVVAVENRTWDINLAFRDAAVPEPPNRAAELWEIAGSLTTLAKVEEVSGDAHLRLGFLQLRLGRIEAAQAEFDTVEKSTTEPFLLYLSRLFGGAAHERQRRLPEAAGAFRRALDAAPRAQTATTMLAALLVRTGRQDEALEAVNAFFEGGVAAADPWRAYRQGDFWRWPALIGSLHEALK